MLVQVCQDAFAQSKTLSFGLEVSLVNDRYEILDEGGHLTQVPLKSISGGVIASKDFGDKLFAETGILFKTYWEGFGYNNGLVYPSSDAFNSVLVPLRVGYKIKFIKGLSLAPTLGGALGINTDAIKATGKANGTIQTSGSTLSYSYIENENVSRMFFLVQPRIKIELTLLKRLVVSGDFYQSFGFAAVNRLDITYSTDNSPDVSAKAISKGQFWGAGLGVAYKFREGK